MPFTADGGLDLPVLRRLIEAAGPLPVTVHKAFVVFGLCHAITPPRR